MKLLKFDCLYPNKILDEKIKANYANVKGMLLPDFHNWLISLRMTFSDFYTYNLQFYGWEAKEVFLGNDVYQKKYGLHLWKYSYYARKLFHRFRNYLSYEKVPFIEMILKEIIRKEKPDVILIREHSSIRSNFWEQFKNTKLVVSRMDCGIPKNWSPFSFDLIYTSMPVFTKFFKAINLAVLTNANGFDERVLNEVKSKEKKYDITFVGTLGNDTDREFGFIERSILLEEVIAILGEEFNFSWWGTKIGDFDTDYPLLSTKYMGFASGLELFTIYAQSKIAINHYSISMGGVPGNQRMNEIMGAGSFLMALDGPGLDHSNTCYATYSTTDECVAKIRYYINNEAERERMAKNGQKFVLENYSYKKLMSFLSDELNRYYNLKFAISQS